MQNILVICEFAVTAALLAVSATAEDSICSVSGHQCVGQSFFKQCDAPLDNILTCEPGSVCSPSEPSGEMCVPEPPPCETEGAFRTPDACDRFYLCINNGNQLIRYIGYCTSGFEYSTSEGRCLRPQDAGCTIQSPSTTTDSSTIDSSTTDSSTIDSSTTDSSTTEIAINSPFTCPSPGSHPDPNNCNTFYFCIRQHYDHILIAIKQKCPFFLPYFNAKRRVCWFRDENCKIGS